MMNTVIGKRIWNNPLINSMMNIVIGKRIWNKSSIKFFYKLGDIMTKITNRKEASAIKNKVSDVKEEYLKGDKCFDEFAKLEELCFEDDFCQYLISKYAKLSRFYLDDNDEYKKEYGDENPSILCFNDIIDYLDGIVSGNFANQVKNECIKEGSCVEVNGINFHPVSKIDVENIDGETLVILYDNSDLIAKIPFYDIISYKIKEAEDDF